MSKNSKSLIKMLFSSIFFIGFISIVITSSFWIYHKYSDFQEDIKELRANYINSNKNRIKDEVNKVLNYINFKKSKVKNKLKKTLKRRVYQAYNTAKAIYEENKNIKSDDEIKYMIVSALKYISFSNKRAYYFINTNDGKAVLFNTKSKLDKNISVWDLKDKKGKYIIRRQAKIAKEDEEDFLINYFIKPDESSGEEYPKISFVKMFKPFNWHIGTGEYLDDFRKDIQQEILDRISNIRFGKEGYIFVNRIDGSALVFNGKKLDKPKFWGNFKDINGVKVFQEELKASQKPEGDYFHYTFKKLTNDSYVPKIGFAKQLKEWEWIIGSGIYVDEINKIIKERETQLREDIKINILTIFIFLLFLTVIIFFFSKSITNYINFNIKILNKFFEEASNKSIEIDREKLNFLEFKTLADSLNSMLHKRNLAENNLKELNLVLEDRVKNETEKSLEKERLLTQQSKMALMGEMINSIAHQWRQPLNALGLTIQKLKLFYNRDRLNEDSINDIVLKSMKQINYMSKTIDDFRNFFKSDKSAEEFLINDVIYDSISIIEAQLKYHNIKTKIDGEKLNLFGHQNEFKQVILNILNNAKDAILDKKIENGVITILIYEDRHNLNIEIKDNAKGIPENIIDRIFEPYFTTKNTEGTGIGLYMSKIIIQENMKGKIEVKNIKDGACFKIKLAKN